MVQEKIIAIIAEKLEVPVKDISAASSFDGMKVDSLAMVEIMLAIEDEYDITIEEAEGIETVADITAYVEQKLA